MNFIKLHQLIRPRSYLVVLNQSMITIRFIGKMISTVSMSSIAMVGIIVGMVVGVVVGMVTVAVGVPVQKSK